MSEEEKIELSPEDGKTGSPEEVHDEAQFVNRETLPRQMRESNGNEEIQINKSEINKSAIAMEVHHHPKVEKKNFKEYFLEFLMIFLAVTMGFIAENIREHFSDEEKAKQYVQTLYYDLKDDTLNLNFDIPYFERQIKRIDTLRSELKKGAQMNTSLANRMAADMRVYGNFQYHDRTVSQLKSSGNFRLLKTALADSIMEYDSYIEGVLRDQESHGQKLYINANQLQDKICESGIWETYGDAPIYGDSVLSANLDSFKINIQNKDALFEYYNALDFWRLGIAWRLSSYQYLQNKAVNIINLIRKEYPIESE
jgi:hypothetical protein